MISNMNIIIAIDDGYGIGKDGKLPWYDAEDLKRFKEITTPSTIIVGRKTYEGLPKKIKKCPERNILVVGKHNYSLQEAVEKASESKDQIYIIGGGVLLKSIIDQYLNLIKLIYITRIQGEYDADVKIPWIEDVLTEHCELKSKCKQFEIYKTIHQESKYLNLLKERERNFL